MVLRDERPGVPVTNSNLGGIALSPVQTRPPLLRGSPLFAELPSPRSPAVFSLLVVRPSSLAGVEGRLLQPVPDCLGGRLDCAANSQASSFAISR